MRRGSPSPRIDEAGQTAPTRRVRQRRRGGSDSADGAGQTAATRRRCRRDSPRRRGGSRSAQAPPPAPEPKAPHSLASERLKGPAEVFGVARLHSPERRP